MKSQLSKGVNYSRPADKSLEAYKVWMLELAQRFTNEKTLNLSEAEWAASWKAYWKDNSGVEKFTRLYSK